MIFEIWKKYSFNVKKQINEIKNAEESIYLNNEDEEERISNKISVRFTNSQNSFRKTEAFLIKEPDEVTEHFENANLGLKLQKLNEIQIGTKTLKFQRKKIDKKKFKG